MRELLTSPKFITIAITVIAVVVIPITIIQVQNQQLIKQQAETILWQTDQSAVSSCSTDGTGVDITVSFTNTEPKRSSTAMDVTAKDGQTGESVDMGSIQGGETKTSVIHTGQATLSHGTVTFLLTWTDGHSGSDSRSANYEAVSDCAPVTPTPTNWFTQEPTPECPAGTTEVGKFKGGLLANEEPTKQTYTINLPSSSYITVVGYTKEGHPEDCPDGPSCHQGQKFEEIKVLINDNLIGESTDQGADVEAWVPVGPWQTDSLIQKGESTVVVAHRQRSTAGPESVDYTLAVCAGESPSPTPTICPTLQPVKNVHIDCPNCKQ